MFLLKRLASSKTKPVDQHVLSAATMAELSKSQGLIHDPDAESEHEEEEEEKEEEEEEEYQLNIHNRFVDQFGDLEKEVENALVVQEQIKAGLRPEKIVKKATTGRIQFDDILIEEKLPPLLLCDNCEKRYSVIYCTRCRECMCLRCCELCHPIPHGEVLHAHERETVHRPPAIRAIQEGDNSSVVVEPEFPIPNYYIEETEAALAKGVDLSKPNTLATNYSDPRAYEGPNTVPFSNQPKYAVDDKLLFVDPVTKMQAYGRVISEWDQRHGTVAPAIIRGDGSMYMYVVEKIDLVENIGTLGDLVNMIAAEKKTPEYPVFKDTEDVAYRWEFAAAREVNRKVNELHEVMEKGPRRHYKDKEQVALYLDDDNEDDDHSVMQSAAGSVLDDDFSTMTPLITNGMLQQAGTASSQVLNQSASDNVNAGKSFQELTGFTVELTKEEQLERLREELPGEAIPTSPRDASKRSFYHAVQMDNPAAKEDTPENSPQKNGNGNAATYMGKSKKKSLNDEPLKIIDENRAQNVFIMMESELQHPNEVFSEEQMNSAATQMNRREAYISRCVNMKRRKHKRMAFSLWHSQLEFLLKRLRNIGARRIQTLARRWLQRDTLQNLIDEWQVICYERWKKLHDQFNYCSRETPYSVTLDHKIYFRTKLDASRYAAKLRLVVGKVIKFIGRKRMKKITFFFKLWQSNSTGLSEADLKFGHLDMSVADIDEGTPGDTGEIGDYGLGVQPGKSTRLEYPNPTKGHSVSSKEQLDAQDIYTSFRKLGPRAVPSNDDFYLNVTTIPLGIERKPINPPPEPSEEEKAAKKQKSNLKGYYDVEEEEEKYDFEGELPPYHPSIGIKLPAAIPVFMPSNAEERLHVTRQRRLTYCSYKAHMQGPCDDACWVIPGKIAMGAIPWGKASKRTQTSSITALLLGGCDVFVSTMLEEEELECEKRLGIQNIGKMLKKASAGARMAVDEVVRGSKRTCEEMEKKLKNIPVLESTHEDYAVMKKELTRCKARVKLATEAAKRAQDEFHRLPKNFEWIRIPIKTDSCPTIHEILPVLWQLERRLSEGRSLYIYSREGHGRCGLLAGCLLGRLYAFNATETLIRIQNSHDCAKREENKPVCTNCPQLNSHKHLITQVVTHTNRPLQGVVYRHHDDPESKHDIVNLPRKGTGLGVDFNHMPKQEVHTQAVPFANITQEEQNVTNMKRQKESVHWQIKLERDVKPSYVTEHGRGEDTVNITEMYEIVTNPKILGQNVDVVRETDLQRQPVNETGLHEGGKEKRASYMPSLRVRREAL